MEWYEQFPILFIDQDIHADNARGRSLDQTISELKDRNFTVLTTSLLREGRSLFTAHSEVSGVVIDWDLPPESDLGSPRDLIQLIHRRNPRIPITLFTDRTTVHELPLDVVRAIRGYFWKLEDTPLFVTGHIQELTTQYLESILPPFFGKLVDYTEDSKYSWHTPGHMGGVAFLKSPAGRLFFDFFGEKALRSDLSVSAPELGSLLDHAGVVGDAEMNAARVFGADHTYFVTNGTSTSNRIVFSGCVNAGDIVLVDRNCHKSNMHAIIMTGAIPVYLIPSRNHYGIIGPIHEREFDPASIREKLTKNLLTRSRADDPIRHAVITNCTYDGVCYDVDRIKDLLSGTVQFLHFDEAWYAYARFHPIYQGRFAMTAGNEKPEHPVLFATQSTHKVLAAFSQASMIHIRDGHKPLAERISHDQFNEAYMMHSSTSPQYGIIASLDVATAMMDGGAGFALMDETIEESCLLRSKMLQINLQIRDEERDPAKCWWFMVWQPDRDPLALRKRRKGEKDQAGFKEATGSDGRLRIPHTDPAFWVMNPEEKWHGFSDLTPGYAMLDPTKVTILCPGIREDGSMDPEGIPATLVTTYLRNQGIVVEKNGFHSFLILMTIGVTRGKTGSLVAALFDFKELYDSNAPVETVFPDIVRKYPDAYQKGTGLADLCHAMHRFLADRDIITTLEAVYTSLPETVISPADAYRCVVSGETELVQVSDLMGRIAAVMVLPYPPGIPIWMPGERLATENRSVIDCLLLYQDFDNRFPGFETGFHGVVITGKDGHRTYAVSCIRDRL